METDRHAIPITDSDLDSLKDKAEKVLSMINGSQDLEEILKGLAPEESYRILPIELELIYSIRHATCLYIWMGPNWLFNKTGQREEAANSGGPTDSILKKQKFSSSYALYIMASYIVNDCENLLKGKKTENLVTTKPNFRFEPGRNFTQDVQILFTYYVDVLKSTNESGVSIIKDALDIIAVSRDYWKAVADRALDVVKKSDASIQAVVINTTFKHNEFVIHGFEIEHASTIKSISFVPTQPEDIVGNTEAVINLTRLADRLALYDLEKKLNPICEFGGLYESILLDGKPGTGKSTTIRLLLTQLSKRAEQMGLDFTFSNLNASQLKSEWFGKSAKLLAEKLEIASDLTKLSVIILDDIDLLLSPRDEPGSGGADKDLLKGIMDFLSGVSSNYKGNYTVIGATNKPTGIDDALRQRFIYRIEVNGAETWEDYADLVALQLKRPNNSGLVSIKDFDYKPLSRSRYIDSNIRLIPNKIGTETWKSIGNFIFNLHAKGNWFTARSIKNAMDVVIAQSADFDVPNTWFTNPLEFSNKIWEDKINMIKSLYTPITTNQVFMAIQNQFDSEERYTNKDYLKNAK